MDKSLKKCSVVESTPDVDDDEKTEIQQLTSTFKKLNQAMKKLDKVLVDNPDDKLLISLKKNETTKREDEESSFECTFASDNCENYRGTIFVKGFDCSLSRDDIKSVLIRHFRSRGRITRVHIPVECKTGASVGFAFLDFRRGGNKPLRLSGSNLGGRKLEVCMAVKRPEYYFFDSSFRGCEKCGVNVMMRNNRRFYERRIRFPC
ncbi:unnamed protein product [Cochlearia groenlandica]